MENESPQERSPRTPEAPSSTIDALLERLGFIETDDLKAIRDYAVTASRSGDSQRVDALTIEYQLRGEELVSRLVGRDYMRGQIGLIVAKASLHRDTGNLRAFLNDIADAKEYACNVSEGEVATALETVPSAEIARILAVYGEEFGFDDQTIAEIAGVPYEQAFEIAYGHLTQAGLETEEILSDFMDIPDSN